MSFHTLRRLLGLVFIALFVTACGSRGSEAPPPVGGLTATPGDGQVVLSWTPDPGVEYWLFYAPTSSISADTLADTPGLRGITNVSSPYILGGLVNGQTYSFTLNGRYDGGPGGPGTPSVSAVPRSAGDTWVAGGAMGTADMRGVTYGGASSTSSIYLAVGSGGALYQSSDKVTSASLNWTQITSSGITANLNAVTYTLSRYLAVGDAGASYYSSDAQTWTAATSATAENLNAMASSSSRVVAVGNNGAIQYSADGVSWTAASAVPTSSHLYGVAYLSTGVWMAVGAGGTLLQSSDGASWTALASGTTADLRGVAYRPRSVTTVTIPTTTTTTIEAAYVAVGAGGVVLGSTDGSSWTARTSNTTADLQTVTPQLTRFLAVGSGGAVITSQDGLTWTAQTSGTASPLYGLVNGGAQYVAVGAGGVNLYSR